MVIADLGNAVDWDLVESMGPGGAEYIQYAHAQLDKQHLLCMYMHTCVLTSCGSCDY